MLEELSCMKQKFGFTCELIPLAPGHAFNRTDARIAHMNTFIRKLKRNSRVFGAEEIARAFSIATNPSETTKRKLLQKSNVFFRRVPPPPVTRSNLLGNMMEDSRLSSGRLGVHGLLYFDFSMPTTGGDLSYPQGYARVRECASTSVSNNPTLVYTWRKDLQKTMCQPCSNRQGRVVPLSNSSCTTCETRNHSQARVQLPPTNGAQEPNTPRRAPAKVPKPCSDCSKREGQHVPLSKYKCQQNSCSICYHCTVLKNRQGLSEENPGLHQE
mmetsp:Transcript_25712/g.36299  ORF Transcript_25712/g.36299 Transcript_25712/m.36299 type:complete len:270 (+) Transcript_25712:852-1661(+)